MVIIRATMLFKDFWLGLPRPEREPFATRCGTTEGHLNNVAYSGKDCRAELAVNIERESQGLVRAETLCPKVDWAYIRGSKGARRAPPAERGTV